MVRYHFTFPFLTEDCGITVEDRIVKPLYKHLFNTKYPSMAFIGIPFQVCPFPLFDIQVQLFIKTLSGAVTLPNKMEMDVLTHKDLEEKCSKNIPIKYFHKMGPLQWQYDDDLANMAGIPCLPPVVSGLYEFVCGLRKTQLMVYKSARFNVTGSDSYERIE
ncbi:Flavin-containing monooxygenase FMO GS-OX-like 5-like [Homarus americanus]|uniref:Flavin-containing monooxygenase n=1 Tax=Homarus americanus TaxID=6706 RepID=A0A8J5IYV9_HOMAM|nr:Flavin-containing monooxygenase FMO GS-OX-like 5-like [Homarus americanus]